MGPSGTRRDARPAAELFLLDDLYPRTQIDADGKMVLSQSIDQRLPPFGVKGSGYTEAPAVVARFSGGILTPSRPDGCWVIELSMRELWSVAMSPAPAAIAIGPPGAIQTYGAERIGISDTLQDGIVIEGGDFAAAVGVAGPGVMASGLLANVSLTSRIGQPLWVPPNVSLTWSSDVANVAGRWSLTVAYASKLRV